MTDRVDVDGVDAVHGLGRRGPGRRDRRVLLVSGARVHGGAERSLLLLAERLPEQGWAPTIACPPGRLADEARRRGLPVAVAQFHPGRQVSSRSGGRTSYSPAASLLVLAGVVANAVRLLRLMWRVRPDAVHSNSLSSHLFTALAGRLGRRPVGWHLREIVAPGPGRRVLDLGGRGADVLVAISAAVADSVRHPRVVVVHNPVAAPPELPVGRPAWAPESPLVGYLGRLDPRKGIEDLLQAMAGVDAHLVVVGAPFAGTPDYVETLRRLAEEAAPGRVHFVGAVDDPWAALAAMDVLVVPSHEEPFGRVAAEGQLAGVCVLATAAGGLPEIVTDGVDGLLVPPADPAALAASLRTLLEQPGLRRRLAAAGRDSAARFEPSQHAATMAALLDGLLEAGPGRRGVGRSRVTDRHGWLSWRGRDGRADAVPPV